MKVSRTRTESKALMAWVLFFLTACSCFCNEVIMETPPFLYKILSLSHWQATQRGNIVCLSADDDAFIHFSKEDQLERILQKYWADAPQVVILKIDTKKLKGDLVLESNPGGTAKYYHLYKGYIPFNSIAESKVVYRHCPDKGCLKIVEAGDPVLRQKARELTKEEIVSPEIQTLIEEMKATMQAAPGVGLAAPQIGRSIQLIVIEDMEHGHLTAEQLVERERFKVPFHVLVNPVLHIEESETAQFFEGCLSVPEFLGVVLRAKVVRVECLNEKGEPVTIHAKGWYARILQHEIDHLQGHLFIDRAFSTSLTTDENYVQFKPHPSQWKR